MTTLLHSLLPDAKTRERLSRYSLAPQHVVDDRHRAAHLSRQRGDGLEFHQYRAYQSGDDLRLVDWRLYARSDRLFVREAQQESRLTVCLLMDVTAAMGLVDQAGIARIEYARRIAAALAWLAVRRQHPLMAIAFGETTRPVLPAGVGMRQLERVCHWLAALTPKAGWPAREHRHRLMQTLPARSLLIAVSDFAQLTDEQQRSWQDLLTQAHALISIQLLLDSELQFLQRGRIEIVEPESGARRLVDAKAVADGYPQRLQRWLDQVRAQQLALGARFVRSSTSMALDAVLSAVLSDRRSAKARLLVGS